MRGRACARGARCGAGLLLLASVAAGQGAVMYGGRGYVQSLADPGPAGSIAFGDFDHDGGLDLAHKTPDGKLTLHDGFAARNERAVIAEGVGLFAVTLGGDDRMWTASDTQLVEIQWGGDLGVLASLEPAGVPLLAPSRLRGQERPGGSRLLVIDATGTRARVYNPAATPPALLMSHQATAGEIVLYDLALADWNGDGQDDLAVVSQTGLRVYSSSQQLFSLPCAPDGAFVDVLPGAATQFHHDFLFFHARPAPSQPALLLVLNGFHQEMLFVDPLHLASICFADFRPDPGLELILPRGDQRGAGIVVQRPTTSETQPVFWIDFYGTNLIDLALYAEDAFSLAGPPPVAVANIDGDGDDDVLFADDRGLGLMVTSEVFDSDLLRAHPEAESSGVPWVSQTSPGAWKLSYDIVLEAPSGTTAVDVEVWHQPSYWTPSEPVLAYTAVLPPDFQGVLQAPAYPLADDVYLILFRPQMAGGPGPAWIEAWSPSLEVLSDLEVETPNVYPWSGSLLDGPGGTVRRPHISPTGSH